MFKNEVLEKCFYSGLKPIYSLFNSPHYHTVFFGEEGIVSNTLAPAEGAMHFEVVVSLFIPRTEELEIVYGVEN